MGMAQLIPSNTTTGSKSGALGKLDGSRGVGWEVEGLAGCFQTEGTFRRLLL